MSEEKKMNNLNDQELEGASGGIIFNASRISGSDPNNPFEVIDDYNGNVLARANTYEQALYYAGKLNMSPEYTEDWGRIQSLRSNPRPRP